MKKLMIFMAMTGLISYGALAQDEVPEASKAPLKAMEILASFAGTWQVQMSYSPDDGATWQMLPAARHEVSFREKNLILTEQPMESNPNAFQSASYYSYDQYRELYRVAVMDDTWGLLDVYEGKPEGDKLILTNLKSGTFFPTGDGRWRAFKLMLDLTGDTERMLIVEKSDDGGASWQPNFKVSYTKQ